MTSSGHAGGQVEINHNGFDSERRGAHHQPPWRACLRRLLEHVACSVAVHRCGRTNKARQSRRLRDCRLATASQRDPPPPTPPHRHHQKTLCLCHYFFTMVRLVLGKKSITPTTIYNLQMPAFNKSINLSLLIWCSYLAFLPVLIY